MRPCSYRRTKVSVTTPESFSSMVKYSCSQLTESPMRRIWRVMVEPLCSFHSQTLATKFLRPRSGQLHAEGGLGRVQRGPVGALVLPAGSPAGFDRLRLEGFGEGVGHGTAGAPGGAGLPGIQ